MAEKLYVVRRHWHNDYDRPRNGESLPVRAFETRESAEHFRAECERSARRNPELRLHNPWAFDCRLEAATSFDPAILRDFLLDAGIEPPSLDKRIDDCATWDMWWSMTVHQGELTDLQFARIWEAMDRYPFYQIIEVELGG